MRDNIQDFVYLNSKNYVSLKFLKAFFWATSMILFIMVVMGVVGKSLFVLTFTIVWVFLYWMLVLLLHSRYIKKNFELRFVVNGITGCFISSLFFGFYVAYSTVSDILVLTFDYFLQIILIYMLFIMLYTVAIVFGITKGVYGKIKNSTFGIVTKPLPIILPLIGVYGMYTSRLVRTHSATNVQTTVATFIFLLLIFLPGLAHINFVKYFYCKKYGIICDEDGSTTSPQLVPNINNRIKKHKSCKNFPLGFKMLVCISFIAILIFIFLFIMGIIISI